MTRKWDFRSRVVALCGLAAIVTACGDATAQTTGGRWTPVSFTDEIDKATLIFVDKSSIKRSGATVELTTLAVRKEPAKSGFDSVRERNRFSCDRREARSLGQDYLARGELVHQEEGEPAPVAYAKGSAWRTLIDSVCDDDMKAGSTDDPRAVTEDYFKS